MDDPFDPKNESALSDLSLADGWQRYVITGRTKTGHTVRPVVSDSNGEVIRGDDASKLAGGVG